MNKLLTCVCTGFFALSAFAVENPLPPVDAPHMDQDSMRQVHQDFDQDSMRQTHQHAFDSLMTANRATMDSLMASHKATIQVCRMEAEQAYKTLHDQMKAGDISKDSLKKVIDTRRAEAQANVALAIQDLKDFQKAKKDEIDKARDDLKSRIADKQKDIKGGIDVALSRLEEAVQRLETKKASTTDETTLAKIDEAIKHLTEVQTHLQAVQQK